MKKPPCIRNISVFKKGCPEKLWDGAEGCTAWVEMTVPDPANPLQKVIEKGCIDLMGFKFQYEQLKLLEGNQKAIESFRNGMVESENGHDAPKINPNIAAMYLATKDQVEVMRKENAEFKQFFIEVVEDNKKRLLVEGSK